MYRRIFFLFLSGTALATEPAVLFKQFRDRFQPPSCRSRFNELSEFKFLFALPEFAAYLENRKKLSELKKALESWSTDLLLKLVLEAEQELYSVCSHESTLDVLVLEMKRLTLARLGLDVEKTSARDIDVLFRGTIALKDDREKIKKRVAELKKIGTPQAKILEMLYGASHTVSDVRVLSAKSFPIKKLRQKITNICGPAKKCPFWNARAIYKVIIVPESGLAGFVPEIGTLVLSQDLVLQENLLHDIVFFHELVHVAEKSIWMEKREDWKKVFGLFSGWEQSDEGVWSAAATKTDKSRKDKLTEFGYTSSVYSALLDAVYLGKDGRDGFAIEKAYTESVTQGPSEDLADHVALARYFPERFCWEGKNLAPKKYEWIRAKFSAYLPPKPIPCL